MTSYTLYFATYPLFVVWRLFCGIIMTRICGDSYKHGRKKWIVFVRARTIVLLHSINAVFLGYTSLIQVMEYIKSYETDLNERRFTMKKKMLRLIIKFGSVMCSLAVVAAKFGVLSCRGQFYQPKEPENLRDFLKINWYPVEGKGTEDKLTCVYTYTGNWNCGIER